MPDITQENRFIQVDTPLGKDALVLASYAGREEMSRSFEYKLEMISQDGSLDATKIVGKSVTFKVALPEDKWRYYNGVVRRFAAGNHEGWEEGIRHYWAEVVPWTWLLSLSANCRIFQDKKVPEIVEQVFKDHSLTDYSLKLMDTYPKLEFCVQWCESDLDFVSRLLEDAGIYYYFKHEDKKHSLILSDHSGGYETCDDKEVKYLGALDVAAEMTGQVTQWEHRYEITSGKVELGDYNFETPATKISANVATVVPLKASKNYEVFEYPGGFGTNADGKHVATARMEQIEVAYDTVAGDGNCATFTPGGKFKLVEHPVDGEKNKQYALIAVEHRGREAGLEYDAESTDEGEGGEAEPGYSNTFRCVPDTVVFRPSRLTHQPRIQGPQTAKIVGPKGNEIFTDKYGRVKVQFPWDREAKGDEKSSCWIRVSQDWAGKNFGSLFLPRVGQEVIVEFLDGNPNRPLITGRVYNADQTVPYKLPDEKTYSGIKTFSSAKGKAKNFNELRFKDQKGEEEIYFHAERDFSRVVENNDTLKIGFEAKDKGDQIIEVHNDRTITVHKGICKLQVKEKDHVVKIDKGNQLIDIKTSQKIKVGDSILAKADKAIELKVGSNSIKIDTKGVTIVGTKVSIQGKAKVEIKAPNTDIKGDAMVKVKGGTVMIN